MVIDSRGHDADARLCLCVYVRGTNRRKINRCEEEEEEEEETDTPLSELVVGVRGIEGEGMWKHTHTHTRTRQKPLFHFKRSRWSHTCTGPSYFVMRDERKGDCHKIANKELRENLKNNSAE